MVYTIPEIRDLLLSSQIISVRYSSRGRFYDAGRVRDEMTAHALPYAQQRCRKARPAGAGKVGFKGYKVGFKGQVACTASN